MPGLDGVVGEMRSWGAELHLRAQDASTPASPAPTREYGELRNHFAGPGGRFLERRWTRPSAGASSSSATSSPRSSSATDDPVGKTLLVNGSPFTVIGVMKKKIQMGTYGGPDADERA